MNSAEVFIEEIVKDLNYEGEIFFEGSPEVKISFKLSLKRTGDEIDTLFMASDREEWKRIIRKNVSLEITKCANIERLSKDDIEELHEMVLQPVSFAYGFLNSRIKKGMGNSHTFKKVPLM